MLHPYRFGHHWAEVFVISGHNSAVANTFSAHVPRQLIRFLRMGRDVCVHISRKFELLFNIFLTARDLSTQIWNAFSSLLVSQLVRNLSPCVLGVPRRCSTPFQTFLSFPVIVILMSLCDSQSDAIEKNQASTRIFVLPEIIPGIQKCVSPAIIESSKRRFVDDSSEDSPWSAIICPARRPWSLLAGEIKDLDQKRWKCHCRRGRLRGIIKSGPFRLIQTNGGFSCTFIRRKKLSGKYDKKGAC
jgi:hypothetical protein